MTFLAFYFIQALGEIALLLKAFLDRRVRAALGLVCHILCFSHPLRRESFRIDMIRNSHHSVWSCDAGSMRSGHVCH